MELVFKHSAEATALLTLLPIYETKSSAAFHATLKAICDLYDLRKDGFDCVANKAMYLSTMNSARSGKERRLDYVLAEHVDERRLVRIVEVGPGGGVVLDLLEKRFENAEVIGIDTSRLVVEALRRRKAQLHRRWQIVEADAFELPAVVGDGAVDAVIFCSVLHEIYSYVQYSDDNGVLGRFRLGSVRDLLRAAF